MTKQIVVRNDLKFYDRSANTWWQPDTKIYALYHLNPLRFKYFDLHVTNWQGLKILDVGCGGGFTCEFMAARNAQVFGIDQSQACIEAAKKHAAFSNLNIEYQHSFSENLPYSTNFFDIVICVDVLEHVADLERTIAEIHRVLKPGGLFCFDTVNRTLKSQLIMIWLLENILRKIPHGIHDWKNFIRPKELVNLMQDTGFKNIEIKGFNLFGNTVWDYYAAYIYYKKTGSFNVRIDNDTSVMYIGKAEKVGNEERWLGGS
jgi:2-polyprenyl-6-hydroxyphenyl methylase/3-demethylubiquinone-9 3-methyltransferase